MQKLLKYFQKTYFLLMLGVAVSMTACKDDDGGTPAVVAGPTITITEDATAYKAGETAKIKINVKAPGKLKSVNVGTQAITTFNDETNATIEVDYVIPAATAAGNHEVTVIAVDKQNPAKTDTKKAILKVEAAAGCTDFLTGCAAEGKTWVLKQGADALWVGPNATDRWWSNSDEDVTGRPCMFNDEWTFKTDGSLTRNLNDDIYVDEEDRDNNKDNPQWPRDMPEVGCHPLTAIPAKYAAWGSGDFTFTNTGGTLTMTGAGAYIGLYKVGSAGAIEAPEATNAYKVISLTADQLVIAKELSGVYWRFTLEPKK